jgi:hypothetical protein
MSKRMFLYHLHDRLNRRAELAEIAGGARGMIRLTI